MRNILYFLYLLVGAYRHEPQTLIHDEYKLNSGSRPGGTTRQLIKLRIPAHTDWLYYAVSATPRNPLHDLGLHSQIRERQRIEGASLSIGTTLLNKLTLPDADGVTDVLIVPDSTEAALYTVHVNEPHTAEDYSRRNVSNCIVAMPIKYSKHDTVLYMCLRNPGAFEAQYVTVEVVAMKRLPPLPPKPQPGQKDGQKHGK